MSVERLIVLRCDCGCRQTFRGDPGMTVEQVQQAAHAWGWLVPGGPYRDDLGHWFPGHAPM